ncbi:MAG: glycosyltransferase [Desulfovibrionaceae bacterium]|nr:glycosyltransferase [Desulfovibrionaceae bacterium]
MTPTYTTTSELKLLNFIPPKAQLVVEIGCKDGSLGLEFKSLNPKAKFVGFEEEENLGKEAALRLDQLSLASFANLDFKRHGLITPLDCVIVHNSRLDSQHLGKLLSQIKDALSSDGTVLFLVDNPGYIRNLLGLLQGQNYLPVKPLQLICQELIAQGLNIDLILAEEDPKDLALNQDPLFRNFAQSLQSLALSQQKSLATPILAKRFLIRASRDPKIIPFRLHTVIGEKLTGRVRLTEPNLFMASEKGVTYKETFRTEKIVLETLRSPKVLILQRLLFRNAKDAPSFFTQVRRAGYLLVYEMDDNPHIWEEAFTLSRALEFVGSHAVQVSTKPLVEFLKRFNPHILYFQNQLKYLPTPRVFDPAKPITIFFGALNRKEDWKTLIYPLNQIISIYNSKIRFKVIWDFEFYKALNTHAKEFYAPSKEEGIVPYPEYAKILHESDIALLPLRDTPINRMKSDLKFIEASGHGCVALASPTVYQDTIKNGRTGFIYHNTQEFVELLKLLIEDRERRLETAWAGYSYVKHNRLLSDHYTERLSAYKNLYANLPKLEIEVDQRMKTLQAEPNLWAKLSY